MIRRILKRLLCLLSPRKCFVLLVLSSVCLLVLIMWNQSVMDGGVAPRGEALRGKILVEPSAARNVSYALLKGEDFVFDVTPEGSVCGGSGVTAALEREEGVRVRWGELLQARPDNEEPAAPAPPESYGVVVVTGACDRLTRESIRRTWGSGAWMKGARIRVVFVCRLMAGSKEDDPMATESRLFADILQYRSRLPTDFLAALIWIQRTCSEPSPDFIVRTTPAAFINLPTLLTTADHLPPGLHGTALRATTPAFLDGLIAHPKDNLLLARHTQYLPTEFVLIKTASSAFLDLIPKIPFVPEEAFFLTGIMADYAELERFRLENVEQTWNGRSGCWINHRSAFLRMKPAEMEELWRALTRVAEFACRQGDGCCEDGWGDIVTSVVIGSLVLVIAYSLLHSYFWSQLSLFCSDICSTVDLDGDEYDDSPELSAVHYDSDREEVVQGQGDTFMGFSGTKAYMQDRF